MEMANNNINWETYYVCQPVNLENIDLIYNFLKNEKDLEKFSYNEFLDSSDNFKKHIAIFTNKLFAIFRNERIACVFWINNDHFNYETINYILSKYETFTNVISIGLNYIFTKYNPSKLILNVASNDYSILRILNEKNIFSNHLYFKNKQLAGFYLKQNNNIALDKYDLDQNSLFNWQSSQNIDLINEIFQKKATNQVFKQPNINKNENAWLKLNYRFDNRDLEQNFVENGYNFNQNTSAIVNSWKDKYQVHFPKSNHKNKKETSQQNLSSPLPTDTNYANNLAQPYYIDVINHSNHCCNYLWHNNRYRPKSYYLDNNWYRPYYYNNWLDNPFLKNLRNYSYNYYLNNNNDYYYRKWRNNFRNSNSNYKWYDFLKRDNYKNNFVNKYKKRKVKPLDWFYKKTKYFPKNKYNTNLNNAKYK